MKEKSDELLAKYDYYNISEAMDTKQKIRDWIVPYPSKIQEKVNHYNYINGKQNLIQTIAQAEQNLAKGEQYWGTALEGLQTAKEVFPTFTSNPAFRSFSDMAEFETTFQQRLIKFEIDYEAQTVLVAERKATSNIGDSLNQANVHVDREKTVNDISKKSDYNT